MTETRIPAAHDEELLFLVSFLLAAVKRMDDGGRTEYGDAVRYVVPNFYLHGEHGDFFVEVQWKRCLQI